ncbi:hypothetical protein INT45_001389 [Circinella minor]|uniref:Pentatricopeptide repeat-containing protein n=1 Tax=Circinella minor TaxID=1195481 RepID=A0A8H7RT46_9FUNG|nr:hypothetical protein INT45_001389 [Circinella minor]
MTTATTATTTPSRRYNKRNNGSKTDRRQCNDPLKERLSTLKLENATQKDLDTIWKLFLQRDLELQQQASTSATKESTPPPIVFPPLVTALFRLIAQKGTMDMMDTLHKRFLHPDLMLLRVEDMEWVIFANIRHNKTGRAHRILNDMYNSGKTPTLETYHHFFREHAKYFHNKRRRHIIDYLVDDMRRRGVHPTIKTYMQLLMIEAQHGSSRERIQIWVDEMMALDGKTREFQIKRKQAQLLKLVHILSNHAHPGLYTVLRKGVNVGLEFDMDIWNKAMVTFARVGNVDNANEILNLFRQQQKMVMGLNTTYHSLIRAYLNTKPMCMDAAIQTFQLMLQDGIVIDESIYNTFLLAYTKHDDQMEVDDELRIKTLRQLFRVSSKLNKNVPDAIVEKLFNFYIERQVLSEAEQLYWDLRYNHDNGQSQQRISRRIQGRVFDTIEAFARKQQLLSAFSLMYDLLANDYWPNSRSVCAIIKGCGARRDLDAAEQLLSIMEDIASDKVKPVVYTTLKYEQGIALRRKQEEEQQ